MGYYIRSLKNKKTSPKWKVQYISYKKRDQKKTSKAKVPKRAWDIPKDRWRYLGFHASMNIEEAKIRAKQLNTQVHLKLQEERLKKTREKENSLHLDTRRCSRQNFWIFVSVWLGLRPQEIDNLQDESMWKIEVLPTKRKVLWIFQTKIVALPPEDRWKPIPLLFEEQLFAFKIIKGKNFKRPLNKTLHKHLGKEFSLYGGRKGFVDLMLSKGQSMENISIWMGHSTLNRTWRSYKRKGTYRL